MSQWEACGPDDLTVLPSYCGPLIDKNLPSLARAIIEMSILKAMTVRAHPDQPACPSLVCTTGWYGELRVGGMGRLERLTASGNEMSV